MQPSNPKPKSTKQKTDNGSDPDPMLIHKGMMYDRRCSTNLGDNPYESFKESKTYQESTEDGI